MKFEWACPKCGAKAHEHGRGEYETCDGEGRTCEGFICECADEGFDEAHGTTLASPCTEASCYHCGWGGTYPVRKGVPKGLQAWEKKALAAGWTPPPARAKELAK